MATSGRSVPQYPAPAGIHGAAHDLKIAKREHGMLEQDVAVAEVSCELRCLPQHLACLCALGLPCVTPHACRRSW